MTEPAVTDENYKVILLEMLEVNDPADSMMEWDISKLEEEVLRQGMDLPIVRRIIIPVEMVEPGDDEPNTE